MGMYGISYDEHGAAQPTGPVVKVGDRVRVTRLGNLWGGSIHGLDVGDERSVKDVVDDGVIVDDGWYLRPHEFVVLPTFSPNHQLRLKRHTATLAAGDIVTVYETDMNGVYVTCKNGRSHYITNEALEHAPDCAERKVEQGETEPKFKAGDVVRGKYNGKLYTIEGVKTHYRDGELYDGPTAYNYTNDGAWDREEDIALVAAAPCPQDDVPYGWSLKSPDGRFTLTADKFTISLPQPAIVAAIRNGKPRPSTHPYVHASVNAATTEAERLAKNNPGQEFAVFQRVTGRVCEVSYSMKEVA